MDRLKKLLLIIGVTIVTALSLTGCVNTRTVESGNGYNHGGGYNNSNHTSRNDKKYYNNGYREGCKAKKAGNTKKSKHQWQFTPYRNGWNNGYSTCSYNGNHHNNNHGGGYNNGNNSSTKYYNNGHNDGCRAKMQGNHHKDKYKWEHSTYRNGWNNGYRNCSYTRPIR